MNFSNFWLKDSYEGFISYFSSVYHLSDQHVNPQVDLSSEGPFNNLIVLPPPQDLEECIQNNIDTTEPNNRHYKHALYPLIAGSVEKEVRIFSLYSLTWVHKITLNENVEEIQGNEWRLAIKTKRFLYLYTHMGDKPVTQFPLYPDINAFSLSNRWVAFSSTTIASVEMDFSDYQSVYSKFSKNLAQFTTSQIKYLSESIRQNTRDNPHQNTRNNTRQNVIELFESHQPQKYSGTIEIRDIFTKKLIAHFRSHKSPIYALQFNASGTLLVTASLRGTDLNVYSIQPSMSGKSTPRTVSHLYTLERGNTMALITSISFSVNSKWVAVGTEHGTTHIYAINPFGGPVGPDSHIEPVTDEWNSLASQCYTSLPKREVLSPVARLRNTDIHRQADNEVVFSYFFPIESKDPSQESLFSFTQQGNGGLFLLSPYKVMGSVASLSVELVPLENYMLRVPPKNIPFRCITETSPPEQDVKQETSSTNSSTLDMDEEGEWLSNLELSSYNKRNRDATQQKLQIVRLNNPITRSNILNPILTGERVNLTSVQLESPDIPIDWSQQYNLPDNYLKIDPDQVEFVEHTTKDTTEPEPKPRGILSKISSILPGIDAHTFSSHLGNSDLDGTENPSLLNNRTNSTSPSPTLERNVTSPLKDSQNSSDTNGDDDPRGKGENESLSRGLLSRITNIIQGVDSFRTPPKERGEKENITVMRDSRHDVVTSPIQETSETTARRQKSDSMHGDKKAPTIDIFVDENTTPTLSSRGSFVNFFSDNSSPEFFLPRNPSFERSYEESTNHQPLDHSFEGRSITPDKSKSLTSSNYENHYQDANGFVEMDPPHSYPQVFQNDSSPQLKSSRNSKSSPDKKRNNMFDSLPDETSSIYSPKQMGQKDVSSFINEEEKKENVNLKIQKQWMDMIGA